MPNPAAPLKSMMTFNPDMDGGRASGHHLDNIDRHGDDHASDVVTLDPEPVAATPGPMPRSPVIAGSGSYRDDFDDWCRHRPLTDDYYSLGSGPSEGNADEKA